MHRQIRLWPTTSFRHRILKVSQHMQIAWLRRASWMQAMIRCTEKIRSMSISPGCISQRQVHDACGLAPLNTTVTSVIPIGEYIVQPAAVAILLNHGQRRYPTKRKRRPCCLLGAVVRSHASLTLNSSARNGSERSPDRSGQYGSYSHA